MPVARIEQTYAPPPETEAETPTAPRPLGAAHIAGASDKTGSSAQLGYWLGAMAVVGLGVLIGWLIQHQRNPTPFTPVPGIGVFAVFYILAQAIERLLEPLSELFGGDKTAAALGGNKPQAIVTRDAAVAAAIAEPTVNSATAAAEAQAVLDQIRANKAVVLWAAASLLAMLASGFFGLYILRGVGVSDAPVALDILVTGLAIGGGTKPLHDLITNIQQSKEAKQDPAETKH